MREIIFRGRTARSGRWVQGDLDTREPGQPQIRTAGGFRLDVRPETVGQYTGMHDRHGRKIFEGDLVESTQSADPAQFRVVWLEDEGRFMYEGETGDYPLLAFAWCDLTVTGNVYGEAGGNDGAGHS